MSTRVPHTPSCLWLNQVTCLAEGGFFLGAREHGGEVLSEVCAASGPEPLWVGTSAHTAHQQEFQQVVRRASVRLLAHIQ